MKKVYMIYNENRGRTNMLFATLGEAEKYIAYSETVPGGRYDYIVPKEFSSDTDIESFKLSHRKDYLSGLETAIEKTIARIRIYESGSTRIYDRNYDGKMRYFIYSADAEFVVKNNSLPNDIYFVEPNDEYIGKTIKFKSLLEKQKFEQTYLPIFKEKCELALCSYQEDKKLLKKYSKEYSKLGKKENEEETNVN